MWKVAINAFVWLKGLKSGKIKKRLIYFLFIWLEVKK